MANNKIRVWNTINGQIQEVPQSFLDQSKYHTPAAEDAVSFDPKLYTPKSRSEFEIVHKRLTEPAVDNAEVVYPEVVDVLDEQNEYDYDVEEETE